MELGVKKNRITYFLSGVSYLIGVVGLLFLNASILIERNIFPSLFHLVLITGVILGALSLFYNRSYLKIPLLSIFMILLTFLTMTVIIIFGYAINVSI